MELKKFTQSFETLFQHFSNDAKPDLLKIELGLYKKFFDFFLTGESFYFSMNHHVYDFEYVSNEVTSILGYKPNDFSIGLVLNNMHPDDRPLFLEIGNTWLQFYTSQPIDKMMKYKVRYDVRIKDKLGMYHRMLYQGLMVEHDERGVISRTIGTYTDITYLKKDGLPTVSFIGIDGEPSYVNVPIKTGILPGKDNLTTRERQILKLLAEGYLSKEIAAYLKISKQTVDTHRKNMLHKKQLKSSGELISKAVKNGWI